MSVVSNVIKEKSGIQLDIGCGENKQRGFVGLDRRKLKGVDIVHDLEAFPYPLPDESCICIIGSHIVEHIKPWLMIDFMNELWRILKVGQQLALALPYAGSPGYWQDPTNCNGCNQATWQYFDPKFTLYNIYKPKPWEIEINAWQVTGNMEVVMRKITESEGKKRCKKSRRKK